MRLTCLDLVRNAQPSPHSCRNVTAHANRRQPGADDGSSTLDASESESLPCARRLGKTFTRCNAGCIGAITSFTGSVRRSLIRAQLYDLVGNQGFGILHDGWPSAGGRCTWRPYGTHAVSRAAFVRGQPMSKGMESPSVQIDDLVPSGPPPVHSDQTAGPTSPKRSSRNEPREPRRTRIQLTTSTAERPPQGVTGSLNDETRPSETYWYAPSATS